MPISVTGRQLLIASAQRRRLPRCVSRSKPASPLPAESGHRIGRPTGGSDDRSGAKADLRSGRVTTAVTGQGGWPARDAVRRADAFIGHDAMRTLPGDANPARVRGGASIGAC
jgi:hypothetical protein